MRKPPQELIDEFFKWYEGDVHSKNEDYYRETITRDYLSGLSKSEFIDFFYNFAHEGGRVQSGGPRTSNQFRQMMEKKYDHFRPYVLTPFEVDFDEAKWLVKTNDYNYFGSGLATIYLNRVNKKSFPILNNKTANSLTLFDIKLPTNFVRRYKAVRDAQQQLIKWFPKFENFYRTDALNQFLIGEEEGKKLVARLLSKVEGINYWVFQANPGIYDLIGALRDGSLKAWTVNQHKKEIKEGDKVIIWMTGTNSGCYGLATVISEVHEIHQDPEDASYYIKKPTKESPQVGVEIRIDENLWNKPVLSSTLNDLNEFSNFPAGRQGTNFKVNEIHFNLIQDLVHGRSGLRYWLYAPGENAKYWDECWDNGIMIFGTDELEDLNAYDSKDAIEKALIRARRLKTRPINDSLAAWEFSRGLKPGDVIIAKKGRKQYIGYGIVNGPYFYDATRDTYRNVRNVKWMKRGEWNDDESTIVVKTLTDITRFPEYVEKLKQIIGIEDLRPVSSLNVILYGPPGTGKTWKLRNEYMNLFTDTSAILSSEEYAALIVSDLAWWKVITMVMMDLKECKVRDIMNHPLMQARIDRSSSANPRAAIWAHIQMHTKNDCPNVNYTKRYEPLLFWKDDNSVWSIDLELANEVVPELVEKLGEYHSFQPGKKGTIQRYEFTTFHQSYSYEDFVEGIKPVMATDGVAEEMPENLTYEVRPGIFKIMVQRALNDPDHNYALFIDEINRGNVANIFGELITLIEEDKRKGAENELTAKLPYSQSEFVVPNNLYLIGAMNTADRSVEALDTALRRRFTFIAVPPNPDLIYEAEGLNVDLKKLLRAINVRIQKLLDKDHCIGHSYFMGIKNFADLQNIFATKIIPLLEEYFYGDQAKIGMVLGKRFVSPDEETPRWPSGDWGLDEFEERKLYTIQDPMNLGEEDFKSIYE